MPAIARTPRLSLALAFAACAAAASGAAGDTVSGITDIGGRVLHLDATQIAPQTSGTDLTTWFDLSGNNRDATESTAAQKPNYVSGAQNGRAAVRFDGGQWLGTTAAPSMNAFTVFAVYQFDAGSLGADRTVVAQFDFPSADREWILFSEAAGGADLRLRTSSTGNTNTNDTLFGATPSGSLNVEAVTKSGGSATMTRNGSVVPAAGSAADPIYADATPFLIGAVGSQPGGSPVSALDGDIAEIVIYDRALSTAERQRVESYLQSKWRSAPTPGLLAYEGFEYATAGVQADGDARENGGVGFGGAWTNTSSTLEFDTVNSLSMPAGSSLPTNGGMVSDGSGDSRARRALGFEIDFDSDGTYYLSTLMRKIDAVNNNGSEFHQVLLVDGAVEKFVMGTDSAERLTLAEIPAAGTGPATLLDETYMLVAKIVTSAAGNDEYFLKVFGSGGADAFADLVTLDEPTLWDLTFSGVITGAADGIELRTGPSAIGQYDEIRIGTTWASVVGAPTPAALPAGLALMLALAARRRR